MICMKSAIKNISLKLLFFCAFSNMSWASPPSTAQTEQIGPDGLSLDERRGEVRALMLSGESQFFATIAPSPTRGHFIVTLRKRPKAISTEELELHEKQRIFTGL